MLRHCYLRNSKSGWTEKKQRAYFARAGISLADEIKDNVYIDRISNKNAAGRFPALAQAVNAAFKGDELVIASHHILGGGMYILATLEQLTKKGVAVRVLETGKVYGDKDVIAFAKIASKQVAELRGRVASSSRGKDEMGGRPSAFTPGQRLRIAEIWRDKKLKQPSRLAKMKSEAMDVSRSTASRITNEVENERKRKPSRKTRVN